MTQPWPLTPLFDLFYFLSQNSLFPFVPGQRFNHSLHFSRHFSTLLLARGISMSVSLALFFIPDVIAFSPLHGRERLWKYKLKSTSSSLLTFFSFLSQILNHVPCSSTEYSLSLLKKMMKTMRRGLSQRMPARNMGCVSGRPQPLFTQSHPAMGTIGRRQRRLLQRCVRAEHYVSKPSLWLLDVSEVWIQLWPQGTERGTILFVFSTTMQIITSAAGHSLANMF